MNEEPLSSASAPSVYWGASCCVNHDFRGEQGFTLGKKKNIKWLSHLWMSLKLTRQNNSLFVFLVGSPLALTGQPCLLEIILILLICSSKYVLRETRSHLNYIFILLCIFWLLCTTTLRQIPPIWKLTWQWKTTRCSYLTFLQNVLWQCI